MEKRCKRIDTSKYVTTDTSQIITASKSFASIIRSGVYANLVSGNTFAELQHYNNEMLLSNVVDGAVFRIGLDKNGIITLWQGNEKIAQILHTKNMSQYINSSAIKAQAATLETKENVNVPSLNNEDMQLTDNQLQNRGGNFRISTSRFSLCRDCATERRAA